MQIGSVKEVGSSKRVWFDDQQVIKLAYVGRQRNNELSFSLEKVESKPQIGISHFQDNDCGIPERSVLRI